MKRNILLLMMIALVGCGEAGHDDLIAFMAEVKARPAGRIDPIPTFTPYKPFDYGATMLRGPFDKPVVVQDLIELLPVSAVAPDPNRTPEYLEQFNIESLQMVGTLEKDGQLWALIDDGQGNVHYVKETNYLGKNHGRIVAATQTYIQVVEIVPNGSGGWVERPRTLELREEQ